MKNKKQHFDVWVSTHDATGDVLSVYFQIRKGKSHEVKEFAEGYAFADYDRDGRLLGIELLGPCKITVVDQIASSEPSAIRQRTKRFVRESAPSSMLAGSAN